MAIEEYKKFLVSYQFDGAQWNIEIPAQNLQEAESRLYNLRFGKVDGEILTILPASMGTVAKIATSLRNFLQRLSGKHFQQS